MKPNITAHNARERGRTIKTQLRLSKGATNTPTGLRDLKKHGHKDPFSCISLLLFIRLLQYLHDVVTTFSISSVQLSFRKEQWSKKPSFPLVWTSGYYFIYLSTEGSFGNYG